MPVYDKPLIHYPLSVLIMAGIREILVITTPRDRPSFEVLLGDGSELGMSISFAEQPEPRGIAQAFHLAADFVDGGPSALILGDNIFYGHGLSEMLARASARQRGATIFGYHVDDPKAYGVVSFDKDGRAFSLEEKPAAPQSNYAVTGLYFYDGRAVDLAAGLSPSARGEFEITDLNRKYLEAGELEVEIMGRGFAWLDTGTHGALIDAANFVRITEERQGLKICCVEELAWRMGFIADSELARLAEPLCPSGYGQYLIKLLERGDRWK